MYSAFTISVFTKTANITSVDKKDLKTSKDHYWPVSISSDISKIYERFMFKRMSQSFEPFFLKFQCGFRKGFSAQKCLSTVLEEWKSAVYNQKNLGTPYRSFEGI